MYRSGITPSFLALDSALFDIVVADEGTALPLTPEVQASVRGRYSWELSSDMGAHWHELFGKPTYSFDHKGVHFVVLNSILTYDEWTFERWPSAEPSGQ